VESLREGRIDHRKCAFIDEASHQLLRRSALAAGDVLISIAGTLGRTAVVRIDDIPANTNQAVALVRPLPVLDPRYAALTLEHSAPSFVAEGGRGVGLQNLNLGQIGDLDIPLPPLNEQRRIVAKLEDLLARSRRAKDALDAIPPLLEKLRQSILAAAFRGDLTADWRAKNPDVEPAEELLKRIRVERRKKWEEAELAKLCAKGKAPADDRWKAKYKEPEPVDASNLPELPEGWCWATFETVGQVDLGRQRAPQYQTGKHTKPYLRVANIKDDRVDYSDVLQMDFDEDDLHHFRLLRGDILLSEGQSPELVGQSAIYDGAIEDLCFQKTLHRLRMNPRAPSPAFAQLLCRHYVRSGVFRGNAPITTNIAHLTLVRLKPLGFPLPPAAEQVEIERRACAALAAVEKLASLCRSKRKALRDLDEALLNRAFRGELVEQDPNDEPASVMLERLAAERNAAHEAPAAPKRGARQKARA
jgi:type I restriction enzyme S subunit